MLNNEVKVLLWSPLVPQAVAVRRNVPSSLEIFNFR